MKTTEELQKEIDALALLKTQAFREERYPDAADCRDKMKIQQDELNERLKTERKK